MCKSRREEVETEGAILWEGGADVETLISLMREKGFGQSESNETLAKIAGMDLDMARSAVLESETWVDQHERNIRIQAELAQALVELSQEENPSIKLTLEPGVDESEADQL